MSKPEPDRDYASKPSPIGELYITEDNPSLCAYAE